MLTIERKTLLPVLERAAKVASPKSPIAVLAHVKIEPTDKGIAYEVSDGTVSVRGTLEATGKIDAFTANAADLLGKAQGIPGDTIKLKLAKGKLTVTGDTKRQFTQQTLLADQFPKSEFSCASRVDVSAGTLKTLLSRVMFAAGTDESRAHMNAAEVVISGGKLKVTCTNGHTAAIGYADIDGSDSLTAIIPLSGCRALLASDADTFSIGCDSNAIHVKAWNEDIRIRALADAFPPVQNVVDSVHPTACATVTASTLLDSIGAIRRAGDRSRVTVAITPTELTLASEREDSQSDGTDTVSCVADKAGEFTVSADYLAGALKACVTPEIKFTAGDGGLDPILIQETGFTAVIMPIRK